MKKFLIPLGLFLGLAIFVALGLQRDPKEIPSPLVGQAAPAFKLFTLAADNQTFEPKVNEAERSDCIQGWARAIKATNNW